MVKRGDKPIAKLLAELGLSQIKKFKEELYEFASSRISDAKFMRAKDDEIVRIAQNAIDLLGPPWFSSPSDTAGQLRYPEDEGNIVDIVSAILRQRRDNKLSNIARRRREGRDTDEEHSSEESEPEIVAIPQRRSTITNRQRAEKDGPVDEIDQTYHRDSESFGISTNEEFPYQGALSGLQTPDTNQLQQSAISDATGQRAGTQYDGFPDSVQAEDSGWQPTYGELGQFLHVDDSTFDTVDLPTPVPDTSVAGEDDTSSEILLADAGGLKRKHQEADTSAAKRGRSEAGPSGLWNSKVPDPTVEGHSGTNAMPDEGFDGETTAMELQPAATTGTPEAIRYPHENAARCLVSCMLSAPKYENRDQKIFLLPACNPAVASEYHHREQELTIRSSTCTRTQRAQAVVKADTGSSEIINIDIHEWLFTFVSGHHEWHEREIVAVKASPIIYQDSGMQTDSEMLASWLDAEAQMAGDQASGAPSEGERHPASANQMNGMVSPAATSTAEETNARRLNMMDAMAADVRVPSLDQAFNNMNQFRSLHNEALNRRSQAVGKERKLLQMRENLFKSALDMFEALFEHKEAQE